jgi:hypothetical protein
MRIQVYEPREVGPQQGNMPGSLPGERRQAVTIPELGRAAQGLGEVGRALTHISQKMQQAAEVQEFANSVVQSSRGLADIHNQIRDDPTLADASVEELEQDFMERSGTLRGQVADGMKEARAKKAFLNQYAEDELRGQLKMRDFGRQRFISKARASTDTELQALSDSLIESGDLQAITKGQAIIEGKVKAGIFSPEEGQQLDQRFRRDAVIGYYERLIENPRTAAAVYQELTKEKEPAALAMVDERTKSALIDKARTASRKAIEDVYESTVLRDMQAKYPNDALKAIEHLENPENYKALSFEGRQKLISFIYSTANRQRLMQEEAQQKQAEGDRLGVFNLLLQNKTNDAVDAISKSGAITGKEKMELYEKIKSYPWKTSQGVYAEAVQKIHSGIIKDGAEIDTLRGRGLSNEDADQLRSKLQAPKYKETMDYAEKTFKLYYPAKEDLEKHVRWLEFVQQADRDIGTQNAERFKAGKPPLTNTEAREIVDAYMQEKTEERKWWFDKTYRPVERWMEGEKPFDLKAEGRIQIPAHERLRLNAIMPREAQDRVADMLLQNGFQVTAENIAKFYRANQGQLDNPQDQRSGERRFKIEGGR